MRAVTRGLVVLMLPMTAGLNVGLTACSSGDSGSGAEAVADDLATGLAAKDLEALPWTHPDTEVDLTAILGSLADTATLSWSWDLGGQAWAYDTTAELVDTGGRWTVTWDPSIVESSLKKGESFDVDTLLPERGDILGAGGKPLVTERDVVHYGLDKTKVSESQVAGSARKIAVALGIDPASYTKRAQAAGPKGWRRARSSRRRSSAPSARPRPRSSRSPRARSRPATWSGCPASRRGTTNSCAALPA